MTYTREHFEATRPNDQVMGRRRAFSGALTGLFVAGVASLAVIWADKTTGGHMGIHDFVRGSIPNGGTAQFTGSDNYFVIKQGTDQFIYAGQEDVYIDGKIIDVNDEAGTARIQVTDAGVKKYYIVDVEAPEFAGIVPNSAVQNRTFGLD